MLKRNCGYFKLQTIVIPREKTWTWLQKGNLKKETESLLMSTENIAIGTSYGSENQ